MTTAPLRNLMMIVPWLLCLATVQATTIVVFRYDDFAADAPNTRSTNELSRKVWLAEQQVDAAFEKAHFPYTMAVIPLAHPHFGMDGSLAGRVPLDADVEKLEFLKRGMKQHRIEVAQHGLSHINHCGLHHRPGEFRERDYQEQFDDIVRGRDILEKALGTKITAFVPPWNGWDENTAQALVAAGFKILSPDRYYYYDSAEDLTLIPCTTTLHKFEHLVRENRLADPGTYVVLYHPFSLVKYPVPEVTCYYSGVRRIEELIQRLAKMPNVQVTTLEHAAEIQKIGHEQYVEANQLERQCSFWSRLLPAEYEPGEHGMSRLLPTAVYRERVDYWETMTVALALGLLSVGVLGRYLTGRILSSKGLFIAEIVALLLLVAGIASEIHLVQRGYHPTGIRAVPIFFAAGFLAATLLSRWMERRRKGPAAGAPQHRGLKQELVAEGSGQ